MSESDFEVELPDGTTRSYKVRRSVVKLRNERIVIHYLYNPSRPTGSRPEYQVNESVRAQEISLSLEALVAVTRAMMERYGSPVEEAAGAAAGLNVNADNLSGEEVRELVRNICVALYKSK